MLKTPQKTKFCRSLIFSRQISAGKLFEVIEEVHEDLIKQEELVRYWETKAKNFKEKYEAEVEKHKNKVRV